MPVLSFRIKLLLAMMLVVGCVSAATLYVTQQRVQANYERLFRKQFERQIGYFTALQESRLGAVKDRCLNLSQSVRLIAAMDPQDIDAGVLYATALDELREVLSGAREEPRAGAGAVVGVGPRGPRATFALFLDAQGKIIIPPDRFFNRISTTLARKRLDQKRALVQGVLDSSERQQVGYLTLTHPTNQATFPRGKMRRENQPGAPKGPALPPPREPVADTNAPPLQEVIVTKIIDPATSHALGTLVLGFPLPELIPAVKTTNSAELAARAEPIQTGILLEDHIYASAASMPEDLGSALAEAVGARIAAARRAQDDFECLLQGVPYRVFYQLLNQDSAFPPAYQVCLYSMEEARREQNTLRWRILATSAAVLLGAFCLSLVLAHGLSVPIRELVTGTGEIQKGNYAFKVPVRNRDELGQLAASFNDMADGLAQKERYRTVLNMVADESVARQLVSGQIKLGGEVREVSVLFCDIRKFTDMTQNMPPAEVIDMLNEHMAALARVVKENHGVLDKFVGDLLMAIFGAPVSRGRDELDAARCALGWLAERERLNATSRHRLGIGIGFVSGSVVAGGVGSADRLNYTVIGPRVNLASRLCSQAAAGEILMDEATARHLGNQVGVQPADVLHLKGFDTPVQAYRLLRVNPATATS